MKCIKQCVLPLAAPQSQNSESRGTNEMDLIKIIIYDVIYYKYIFKEVKMRLCSPGKCRLLGG